MINDISIKSVALNRVRLKSELFSSLDNLLKIEARLGQYFESFRENLGCKSIIFVHKPTITAEEIIEKIGQLFEYQMTQISKMHSISASQAVCGGGNCTTCSIKKHNPKTWKRKLIEFGILSLYAVVIFIQETFFVASAIAFGPVSLVAIVALVAAIPLLQESWDEIKNYKFTLHTFMGGTLLLAIFFGEAIAAFEIVYILRAGMLLEEYLANKSKDEIAKLVELGIKKVYIEVDNYEIEVDIDSLSFNDIVVVRSGEKIPVDGTILRGNGEIDESIINGRSEATFKNIGDKVFAGTICERGKLYLKIDAIGNDTYISRTIKQVEMALAKKSPSQVEADILASKLLKLGTILTVGTFVFTGSLLQAFSVMIMMSCPCATILAASAAISAGISNGAKNGILIKSGESFENVSKAEVFCFDKTGTLTTGKPLLANFFSANQVPQNEVLRYAAIAEFRNSHPIAKSIIEYANANELEIECDAICEIIAGMGIKAKVGNQEILVGNLKLLRASNIDCNTYLQKLDEFLNLGQTPVFVCVGGDILGLIGFSHEIRSGTKEMMSELRRNGVKHIALITGDDDKVANAFAKEFDFDFVYSNQTPDEKAKAIDVLREQYGKVVMVGDGVNDTFAMSKADVAISFAAGGSEAAIAISDIAITHSHPDDVVYLHALSKKSLKIVKQNYYIGTGTNLAGVALSWVGKLSPVGAGLIHIGHTLGIMANSARLLR